MRNDAFWALVIASVLTLLLVAPAHANVISCAQPGATDFCNFATATFGAPPAWSLFTNDQFNIPNPVPPLVDYGEVLANDPSDINSVGFYDLTNSVFIPLFSGAAPVGTEFVMTRLNANQVTITSTSPDVNTGTFTFSTDVYVYELTNAGAAYWSNDALNPGGQFAVGAALTPGNTDGIIGLGLGNPTQVVYSLDGPAATTPEPGSLVLLATGIGFFILVKLKRQRQLAHAQLPA